MLNEASSTQPTCCEFVQLASSSRDVSADCLGYFQIMGTTSHGVSNYQHVNGNAFLYTLETSSNHLFIGCGPSVGVFHTAYAENYGKYCPAHAGLFWRNAQGTPSDVSVTCVSSSGEAPSPPSPAPPPPPPPPPAPPPAPPTTCCEFVQLASSSRDVSADCLGYFQIMGTTSHGVSNYQHVNGNAFLYTLETSSNHLFIGCGPSVGVFHTAYAENYGKYCPAHAGLFWRNAQGTPSDVSVTCVSSSGEAPPPSPPFWTPGTITPARLKAYYNVMGTAGSNLTSVAVFEAIQRISPLDVDAFLERYGLPPQRIEEYLVSHLKNSSDSASPMVTARSTTGCFDHPHGCVTDTSCSWQSGPATDTIGCSEATLDVQYLMGVASGTGSTTTPFYYWYDVSGSWANWIEQVASTPDPPRVFSISFGGLESQYPASVMLAFEYEAIKLGLQGVTILVASGDAGASGIRKGQATACGYEPQFPTSCPYVTSVGATMGAESGLAEVVCSTAQGAVITSTGGFSNTYPLPEWQAGAVSAYFDSLSTQPLPGFSAAGRGFPDIAMAGYNYEVLIGGTIRSEDGTSASTPVAAAMVSLVNAERAKAGLGSIGWINPTLYASPDAFNDITDGDNKCFFGNGWTVLNDGVNVTCCPQGFDAAPGWDPTTGLGSIDFAKFRVLDWGAAPLIPPMPPAPPLPPSPPSPPSPPPAPPVAPSNGPSGLVMTTFIASGDISEYDVTRLSAIKRVIASAANVDTASVSLTATASSVQIAAEISVPNIAVANSTSAMLASGIFASPSALQAALASGGAPGIAIVAIVLPPIPIDIAALAAFVSPPNPALVPFPSPSSNGGSSVGGVHVAAGAAQL